MVYIAIIVLLQVVRRKPVYDRQGYKEQIRLSIEQWLTYGVAVLAAIVATTPDSDPSPTEDEKVLGRIGEKLVALQEAKPDQQNAAIQELIQTARIEGIHIPDPLLSGQDERTRRLKWNDGMAGGYERLGHICEGDEVFIEREAVMRNGEVLKQGLVRKIRT